MVGSYARKTGVALGLTLVKIGIIALIEWLLQYPFAWLYPGRVDDTVAALILAAVISIGIVAVVIGAPAPLRSPNR